MPQPQDDETRDDDGATEDALLAAGGRQVDTEPDGAPDIEGPNPA